MRKRIKTRPSRPMWTVEKFFPSHCPKCGVVFLKEGKDYSVFTDAIPGVITVVEHTWHDIIVCKHCKNYAARVHFRTWCVETKKEAEALIENAGFVNLLEIFAGGMMAQRTLMIVCQEPQGNAIELMHPDSD